VTMAQVLGKSSEETGLLITSTASTIAVAMEGRRIPGSPKGVCDTSSPLPFFLGFLLPSRDHPIGVILSICFLLRFIQCRLVVSKVQPQSDFNLLSCSNVQG
jgi:hypothetical protein